MLSSSIELKQTRQAVADQAKGILDKADGEKRGLTAAEEKEYRELSDRVDSLNHDILKAETEEHRAAEAARVAYNTRGGNAVLGNGGRTGLRYFEDGNGGYENSSVEVGHVLPPNRSVHSYLESRGLIYQHEFANLGFGQFLRAMVCGPQNGLERRALSEGTDSAGGYSVPDIVLSRFIDKLRANTVCIQAGAGTVPLTSDKTTIARIATYPAAAWRNENAAVAESDPTFEGLIFVPRSLAVLVKVSRELVEDSVNIERMLETAFTGALSVELDRVALIGSGSAPEPRGISNTTNVGSVAGGGALTSYDKVLDAVYEILVDNGAMPTAIVMPPRTQNALAKLKEGTTNAPLPKLPLIADIPMLATTSLPINETPGTSSRLIMGDFTQLLFGIRTSLRIEVLRELFAGNLQYGFLAWLRADIGLQHPESFSQITGILP